MPRRLALRLAALSLAVQSAAANLPLPESPVALLLPDPQSHTKLVLQEDALALLRSLRGPLGVVSVVGAYRTGKSFLLVRAREPTAHPPALSHAC